MGGDVSFTCGNRLAWTWGHVKRCGVGLEDVVIMTFYCSSESVGEEDTEWVEHECVSPDIHSRSRCVGS